MTWGAHMNMMQWVMQLGIHPYKFEIFFDGVNFRMRKNTMTERSHGEVHGLGFWQTMDCSVGCSLVGGVTRSGTRTR